MDVIAAFYKTGESNQNLENICCSQCLQKVCLFLLQHGRGSNRTFEKSACQLPAFLLSSCVAKPWLVLRPYWLAVTLVGNGKQKNRLFAHILLFSDYFDVSYKSYYLLVVFLFIIPVRTNGQGLDYRSDTR